MCNIYTHILTYDNQNHESTRKLIRVYIPTPLKWLNSFANSFLSKLEQTCSNLSRMLSLLQNFDF